MGKKPKTIITEIALYSVTPWEEVPDCPWRAALRKSGVEFKDLNYVGCDADGRRAAVEPLKTWFDETMVEVDDMPFVVVQTATEGGGGVQVHLIGTVDAVPQIGRL